MLCSDCYVLIIISIIILINTLSIVYIFIVVQWYKMIPLSFFNKLTKLGVNKQFKAQLLINCLYMLMDLQYLCHQMNILAGGSRIFFGGGMFLPLKVLNKTLLLSVDWNFPAQYTLIVVVLLHIIVFINLPWATISQASYIIETVNFTTV